MNILHYSLGFPPYRSGGMTKFCMDLMEQQISEGHQVSLLWPGEMRLSKKLCRIKEHGKREQINSFEIINPAPVSYDEGIRSIPMFINKGKTEIYQTFLKEQKPDVIHIHTLMGLHKAFLEAAKYMDIRIVFTAHDFFPICPKVTLYKGGNVCTSFMSCEECGGCNQTALPIWKIRVLQTRLYRTIKDSAMIGRLRRKHRNSFLSERNEELSNLSNETVKAKDYQLLRSYYLNMLEMMDVIHYNSTLTREIYEQLLKTEQAEVISISHKNIKDNRKVKSYGEKIKIGYLGPQGGAKGYLLLKDVLDELYAEGKKFTLRIPFEPIQKMEYMIVNGSYTYDQLSEIFAQIDVLVVPSVWYETFGYTVLEALSYGVPVVVSSSVGARDIIPEGAGLVFRSGDKQALKETIEDLTPLKLEEMNRSILKKMDIMTIKKMNQYIEERCYKKA